LCWSNFRPERFVSALLKDARPKLTLCLSWIVEKMRNTLSWPEQNGKTESQWAYNYKADCRLGQIVFFRECFYRGLERKRVAA
jgi:hypothetical protein